MYALCLLFLTPYYFDNYYDRMTFNFKTYKRKWIIDIKIHYFAVGICMLNASFGFLLVVIVFQSQPVISPTIPIRRNLSVVTILQT